MTRSSESLSRNTILITGAGGCIGSALAKRILSSSPATCLLLLDHSEQNLYEIHTALTTFHSSSAHVPILGDISDESLLDKVLNDYRPASIFHAAAFKHVPLMEANPIAVIRNNILGTYQKRPTLVAGTGSAKYSGWTSIAQLFTGGTGKAPAMTYTWKQALDQGADGHK